MFPTVDIVSFESMGMIQISKITCPVCLIHGTDDTIVPLSHAQQLFLTIPPEYRYRSLFVVFLFSFFCYVQKNAGHNNIELYCMPRSLYSDFIADFLVFFD